MALYYRKKLAKGGYGLPLIFVLVVLWGTIVFMVVRNVEAPADEPLVPVLPPPQGPVMTDGERRAPAPTQDSPVMPKDATNVSPPSVEIIVENTEDSRAAAVATPPTILETGTLNAKVEDVEDSVPKLIPLSILNDRVRPAVVNILCTTNTGGVLFPISGSGVIIDPRGIILTNAHVAQYYLLTSYRKSGFIDCTIRTGSPAKNAYKAELLYLSPPWVAKNAKNLIATDPVATGEDDFALLYITGSTKGAGPLPVSFPFVAPAVNDSDIKIGTGALAASYPAGFLGGSAIRNDGLTYFPNYG
jgi:hypothetical protein